MSRGNEVPDFYDCEASCLGDLLIEVGWAFVDMSTGDIRSEGHLVRPPSHWDMQRVWDQDAEKLHGFSLGQLRAHGRPPLVIARRMNEVLADRELFSDGPADDERWLRIIFDEVGSLHEHLDRSDLSCAAVRFERALMKVVQGHAINSIGVVILAEYNQFRSRFRTMYRTKPLIS
jgi:hypothetical protein